MRTKYGDVYKDTVSGNVVVSRFVELYSEAVFKTFHDFVNEPTNSKSWYLDAGCELVPKLGTEISKPVSLLIRPKGTWTITTKLLGDGPRVELYPFTITWPSNWASAGYTSFTFHLKTVEEARAWHQAIADSIKRMATTGDEAESGGTPAVPATAMFVTTSMPEAATSSAESLGQPAPQADLAVESIPESITTSKSMPAVAATDPDSEPDLDVLPERPTPAGDDVPDGGKKWRVLTERWVPYKQVNGVAIYHLVEPKEDKGRMTGTSIPGLGGEFMVSTCIRGPPSSVLSALLHGSAHTTILGPASVVELLKEDTNSEELRLVLEAPGWAGKLCAPREMVVERILKTDGNMHVVIFSSIDKGNAVAKPVKLNSLYTRPVVGLVRGNYIISPLNGHRLDTSPETMITCILKVDLRGACGDKSWLRPFSDLFGFTDAFLDRILMTVILVRDEVEHSRFVLDWQNALSEEGDKDVVHKAAGPALSRTVSKVQRPSFVTSPTFRSRSSSKSAAAAAPDKMGMISEGADPSVEAAGGPVPEPVALDMERIKSKATLDPKYWEQIHTETSKAAPFKVRGPTYLKDRKKIPGGLAVFSLASIDLVTLPHAVDHIARYLPSVRQSGAPFAIVINLIIPGHPLLGLVSTFITDRHPLEALGDTAPANPMSGDHDWQPFDFVLHKFLKGTDAVRNTMFKLIPHIANGSWVIRQSVGTVPVIIGKALKTSYFQTPQYLEIDIDVSANSTAAYVTGMVRGATTGLIIDMGFVLEGTSPWEVPESLLGAMRLNFLDTTKAKPLDLSREIPLVPAMKPQQQQQQQEAQADSP